MHNLHNFRKYRNLILNVDDEYNLKNMDFFILIYVSL